MQCLCFAKLQNSVFVAHDLTKKLVNPSADFFAAYLFASRSYRQYLSVQSSGDLRRADVRNSQDDCQEFRASRLDGDQRRHGRCRQVRALSYTTQRSNFATNSRPRHGVP